MATPSACGLCGLKFDVNEQPQLLMCCGEEVKTACGLPRGTRKPGLLSLCAEELTGS